MKETKKAKKEYVIDAKNKSVGRISTQIATILMGKNTASFAKNKVDDVIVRVENASKVLMPEVKLRKTHSRYSGYPGGLVKTPVSQTIAKKGYGEIIKKAVKGMLPKNKLQTKMLQNLVVTE